MSDGPNMSRFSRIQVKLTLLTSGAVFLSVASLSVVILYQYESVLLEKTLEVCRNLSAGVSSPAREELLVNDIFDGTRNAIESIQDSGIKGLRSSYVVNKEGLVVAHSRADHAGTSIGEKLLREFDTLRDMARTDIDTEEGPILRFAFPIFVNYRDSAFRVGTGVFEFDRTEIYRPVQDVRRRILVTSVILLVGGFVTSFLLARRLARPVQRLAYAASEIRKGNLGVQVKSTTHDEIGHLARIFNDMSTTLKDMESIRANQAAMSRELEIARGIQLAVLPLNADAGPYSFHGYMKTADEVGGDYYDCIYAKAGRKEYWWFIIGDVSGHGLRAGLIMLMAQTALHTALELRPDLGPEAILAAVNRVLFTNIQRLHERKYMTAALYRADNAGNFVTAGLHLDTIILRARGRMDIKETDGMWLGLEEDISPRLKPGKFKVDKAETVFLYTDGVTESMNPQMQLYSEERLTRILADHARMPLAAIEEAVLADLDKHRNGGMQMDDISFTMIRRNR